MCTVFGRGSEIQLRGVGGFGGWVDGADTLGMNCTFVHTVHNLNTVHGVHIVQGVHIVHRVHIAHGIRNLRCVSTVHEGHTEHYTE